MSDPTLSIGNFSSFSFPICFTATGNGVATLATGQSGNDKDWLDLENLKALLPDADPNHLLALLEEKAGDPQRVQKIGSVLIENRDYPKLKVRGELL